LEILMVGWWLALVLNLVTSLKGSFGALRSIGALALSRVQPATTTCLGSTALFWGGLLPGAVGTFAGLATGTLLAWGAALAGISTFALNIGHFEI
jgi:hypothetical protein